MSKFDHVGISTFGIICILMMKSIKTKCTIKMPFTNRNSSFFKLKWTQRLVVRVCVLHIVLCWKHSRVPCPSHSLHQPKLVFTNVLQLVSLDIIYTWAFTLLHNIIQLLGCVSQGLVSRKDSCPFILGFLIYGEHSCCVLQSFQQVTINYQNLCNCSHFLCKETTVQLLSNVI